MEVELSRMLELAYHGFH